MACEKLKLEDMTLRSVLTTLGSIPAPHVQMLTLSRIALADHSDNLEGVDYNHFFEKCTNREVIENVVRPENLRELKVVDSDRVLELVGSKWKFSSLTRISLVMGCDWNEASGSLKDTIKAIVSP